MHVPEADEPCICGSLVTFDKCCQGETVFSLENEGGMHLETIGGTTLYRPSPTAENKFRLEISKAVRERFRPGVYQKYDEIQDILHFLVDWCGSKFDALIPFLASRDLLEFLLWQFDLTAGLDDKKRMGYLRREALQRWNSIGPTHERTLKYMAERITMLSPGELGNVPPTISSLDESFIYAEELVQNCILSDQTRILKDKTKIEIFDYGTFNYMDHQIEQQKFENFGLRVSIDAKRRSELFGGTSYESDFEKHALLLDAPLRAAIGVTFRQAIVMLTAIKNGCRAHPENDMAVKFIHLNDLLKNVSEAFGQEISTIRILVDGFSLRKEDLTKRAKKGEDLWNPKYEARAYRRALFVVPHHSGMHVIFTDRMFDEAFQILLGEVCFEEFPVEWKSPDVKNALSQIGIARGAWFEQVVATQMKAIGLNGVSSKKIFGKNRNSVKPPGELDFIGYSPADEALILFEAKMLQTGTEPKLWINQINSFIEDKFDKLGAIKQPCFLTKFKRKVGWLSENAASVIEALRSEGIEVRKAPTKVCFAFITYTPCPAAYFVKDVPCIALTEFLENYKANGSWPYKTGIQNFED
jgi:hypothetical protein